MNPLELLLSKLDRVTKSGTGWSARCPAHDDGRASLTVTAGDDGRALVLCFVGCPVEAVTAAAGLGVSDLFPPKNGSHRGREKNSKPKSPAYPSAAAAVHDLESRHGPRSGLWTYTDAAGEPVGLTVRWDRAGGGKDIRPIARHPDGWRVGAMTEP